MNTITAILDPDADGTLHLPLPPDLRRGKVKINATIEAAAATEDKRENASPLEAFRGLRRLGGLKSSIPDPVAWQREQRAERDLPDRSLNNVAR